MKYFFILSAMLVIHLSLIRSDRSVIDLAVTNKHAFVVSAQTVKNITLDPKDMSKYAENLLESSGELLDTTMLLQIISHSNVVNTELWQDDDFKNILVVQSRDEEISRNYVVEKLNLSGKKQLRYYTRQINKYNETDASGRNIFYFSKPVYDNTGRYAVVQWSNEHAGSSNGSGIDLYRLDGREWKVVGVISSWKNK